MKPATAASKLGILLGAAPEEFQTTPITRAELDALREDPPQWLGVSKSGLARARMTEPLDADQVGALLADPPEWLVRERETHREVVAEQERLREQRDR